MINVSSSRTQCSDAGEASTCGPLVSSQATMLHFTLYTIYHIPHARIQKGLSDNVFALVDEGREDPNTTARGPLGPGLLT